MKKFLVVSALALFSNVALTQIVVPNGGFENWTSAISENPQYYPYTSNSENYYRYNLPFNLEQSTDAYHGLYAVSLTTVASATDTAFGYFINSQPDGDPSKWHGGMPYSEMPTGIRGHYKYNVATADSATLFIIFSKLGVNVGSYFLPIGGNTNGVYTLFDLPLVPALSVQPDSVMFGALSCKFSPSVGQPWGPAGSSLLLDSVSFVGVATQPALMDGDFELWSNTNFNSLDMWNFETDNGQGFAPSTDAVEGIYSLQLSTYLGNENGQPAARSGYASTGYYPNNCNGNCTQLGGYPFDKQKDTLIFSYKYAPSADDVATVQLNFKKNGVNVGGTNIDLVAKANYQYVEMPFDIGQVPDSVIISIMSSNWNNKDLKYVGSLLHIDDLKFKAKPVVTSLMANGANGEFTVVPNPSTGFIELKGLGLNACSLEVVNVSGDVVYRIANHKLQSTLIDLTTLPKGLYLLRVVDSETIKTVKLLIK